MYGAPSPILDDDPALAIARAMALAHLHDELAAASSAARDAATGVPSTTFDWFGPSSVLFADAAARLHRDIEGARAALATATRIVAAELA